MKKILFAIACLLFISTSAMAGMSYIDGTTTGIYYDEKLDKNVPVLIRLYSMHSRRLIDDLTYIEASDNNMLVKSFILENGLPGFPNRDTVFERKRIIKQLHDALLLMAEARLDGKDFDKHLARFYGIELYLKSQDKGADVKVGILIHDYEQKVHATVYLNDNEVTELIILLKKVPAVISELRATEPKYPALP